MGREIVPQQGLQDLLDELQGRGATNVRRLPARFDGSVEVTWDEPGDALREEEYREDLRAYVPVYLLSGLFLLLVGLVFAVITFLTGGLAGP